MKLELESPNTNIFVKNFTSGKITLNNSSYDKSIIFSTSEIVLQNWEAAQDFPLTSKMIEPLLESRYDIILFGTGVKSIIVPKDIIALFARNNIVVDFMNSSSACKTFNILAQEQRDVIAAIIV